jgi:dihydroxy-acid dehydratase
VLVSGTTLPVSPTAASRAGTQYAFRSLYCIGHVVPEAQVGGPIALVRDGDVITVDAVKNSIDMGVSDDELARRRAEWKAPPLKVSQGTLYKYVKLVEDASKGCITDA